MELNNATKLTEKFSADFQKMLTPDNSFYLNTKGETSADISVNIPQFLTEIAGPSDATSNGPLDVVEWVDDNLVVTQKRFRTKAYQIVDFDAFFAAQDQRMNAMDAMKNFIDSKIGDMAAYKFATNAQNKIVYTTGTVTRATGVVGSTATVKTITEKDMIAVRTLMGKSNMPGQWYALMSPEQIGDLLNIANFTTADKLGIQSKLISGQFADILGIKIFQRAPRLGANVAYEQAGDPGTSTKVDIYGTIGTAAAVTATTVGAAIFWNENALYSAKGLAKAYVTAGDARYQSDLLSLNYTFGVEAIRKDGVGLIALVEDIA
jgi:hypothetical protein